MGAKGGAGGGLAQFLVGTASYAGRRIRRQLSTHTTDRLRTGPYGAGHISLTCTASHSMRRPRAA